MIGFPRQNEEDGSNSRGVSRSAAQVLATSTDRERSTEPRACVICLLRVVRYLVVTWPRSSDG